MLIKISTLGSSDVVQEYRIWPLTVQNSYDYDKLRRAKLERRGIATLYPEVNISYVLVEDFDARFVYNLKFEPTTSGLNFTGFYRLEKCLPLLTKTVKTFESWEQRASIDYKRVGLFNVNQDIPIKIVFGTVVTIEARPIN